MALHRFFLPPEQFQSEQINVQGELAHQILRVLRLPLGAKVVLLDNSGREFIAELSDTTKNAVIFTILDQQPAQGEPIISLTLYQALLKGEKFDFVLQKGTEVGISRFVPVLLERCVSDSASSAKLERWRKIVREAAEQSRRGILPVVADPVLLLKSAIATDQSQIKLIAWEEATTGLKDLLSAQPKPLAVSIIIGPEGGITPAEVSLAASYGFQPVSLGKRILRAETAGLVLAANILYHFE
jgi:16S rRNA (uracil1498-N3)-methyltransferase